MEQGWRTCGEMIPFELFSQHSAAMTVIITRKQARPYAECMKSSANHFHVTNFCLTLLGLEYHEYKMFACQDS